MQYWVSRYAKNQAIEPLEARKLLRNVNTKHWELTLEQFEAKARAGGYGSELDAEYFKSRVARLQDLERQLQQTAMPYAKDTQTSLSNTLVEQYDETYMRTTFNIQAQKAKFTSNFARFNDNQMKIVVSMPWAKDGKDFSSRVWKDYTKDLPSYLMDSVLRGTLMGYSPQRISKMFHARFQDAKRNDIHRLVITEMAHVAEEATAKSYEENEIDWYEYMATLESHTCTICARLDGSRFKVSERRPGINYPTIHSRCRCTTVPWIEDLPDVKKRWYRDPKTGKGKLAKNMKFDEWKRLIDGNQSMPKVEVNNKYIEYKSLNNPLKPLTDKWHDGLNEDQKQAVDAYTLDSYFDLNQYLRGDFPKAFMDDQRESNLTELSNKLSEAIGAYSNRPNMIAYRSMKPSELDWIKEHKEFPDFKSTSVSLEMVEAFRNDMGSSLDVLVQFKISSTARAAYLDGKSGYQDEGELVLDKNTKYNLIENDGKIEVIING